MDGGDDQSLDEKTADGVRRAPVRIAVREEECTMPGYR